MQKNREKGTRCSLKTTDVPLDPMDILDRMDQVKLVEDSFKKFEVIWSAKAEKKQKKKFCLISGLKFTLLNVTSFLPDNLPGFKIIYIQAYNREQKY